ncbi:hypothetical protein BDV95DRAFT_610053 [Massariosphaeria phaeospora]|uniref:Plastocyanin-like domain-containing protein n=1 Tax=Massariosphaeria phaeospora TaxID=100035 RepID=A0A7C8M4B2_9PLEO|nr:hypothetical protein BDV95DRAFT_610053 [Massariosphaeria phaeospora]
MRLPTLLSTLLALSGLATSLTLHRANGTTIELGDRPMEVDLTDVVFPEPDPSQLPTNSAVHVYDHTWFNGDRHSYAPRNAMGLCVGKVAEGISSILFNIQPDFSFYCYLFK